VKLLSDHRHHLVVQRTRIASQVRWYLHELDPDLVIPSRGLKRHCLVAALLLELDRFDCVVSHLTRNLLTRCDELNHEINTLETELCGLVRALAPSLLDSGLWRPLGRRHHRRDRRCASLP
jgi:transposase